MIYYYFDGEQEKTFTDILLVRKQCLEDGISKFRDSLGGEYFITL